MAFKEVGLDSRGNTLFVEDNGVGGRCYFSDEIGGGVIVWDTSLVSAEMVGLALGEEARLLNIEIDERLRVTGKE